MNVIEIYFIEEHVPPLFIWCTHRESRKVAVSSYTQPSTHVAIFGSNSGQKKKESGQKEERIKSKREKFRRKSSSKRRSKLKERKAGQEKRSKEEPILKNNFGKRSAKKLPKRKFVWLDM